MDFKVFSKSELTLALGAIRSVEPEPSPDQDALLVAVAALHGVDLFPPALPRPSHGLVAHVFRDVRRRRRLLELSVAYATRDGQVRRSAAANLALLACTLGQNERDVTALRDLASHYYLRARIDFTRRMAARLFGDDTPAEPERGLGRRLSGIWRASEDRELAERFRALGRLGQTSFGYAVWAHYRQNHFRLPGEGGGVAERLLNHDLGHVLSGYATDAMGELQQAAFQTGCLRDDGFMPLYLGILQFQFAERVTREPAADAAPFDCEKVSAAIARGAACRVDLGGDWDFWPLLPEPLGYVRELIGMRVRSAVA